ncbi:MAG: 16S rRNA (uracil(1498)-N(3))-methyltransferase [Bacteriovoracaceae bacterium]|nr:16S rRNA (uracil(1498)-N(3))-methyltransferase [Bacteriovoracaceae bacterium]
MPTLAQQISKQTSPFNQVTVTIDDLAIHHLKHVVRLRAGEKILLLDGLGQQLTATMQQILADTLILQEVTLQQAPPPRPWDLVVGLTQEFDEVVRMAQELGVRRLYPWNSAFSDQRDWAKRKRAIPAPATPPSSSPSLYDSPMYARWRRIAVSALEQSNAPWLIEIDDAFCSRDKQVSWTSLLKAAQSYRQCITAHGDKEGSDQDSPPNGSDLRSRSKMGVHQNQELLLIIGPEGGIAPAEWALLKELGPKLTLPTPILRTPTAVATIYGHLLAEGNGA